MRVCYVIGFLSLLALPAAAPGQPAPAATRVGYVEMKRLLEQAPQVIAGRQRLDAEFRARNDELETDDGRLAELREKLRFDLTLDEEQTLRLEQEIRILERSIERRRGELRQELQLRRNEEIRKVEDDVNRAVAAIAEQQGYQLVVASPVVYASPAIDITDRVLEHLKVEFARDQAEAQNPPGS